MDEFRIRELVPADIPSVRELMRAFLPVDFVFRRSGNPTLPEQIDKYEKIMSSTDGHCLLVLDGEEIIGLVITKMFEVGIRRLVLIWVNPEYRGRRLASQLISLVVTMSRRNREDLFMSSWSGNIPADTLYRSLGFEVVANVPKHRVNGDDTVLYLKRYGKIPLEYYTGSEFLKQA